MDTAVGPAESLVGEGVQTTETSAFCPTLAQLCATKDALGLDPDTYTPLAADRLPLRRIRVTREPSPSMSKGIEGSDYKDFGRAVPQARGKPEHVDPPMEPADSRQRGLDLPSMLSQFTF